MSVTGAQPPDPDLLARLERLGVSLGVPAAPLPAGPRPDVLPIEEAVPGRAMETPHGVCWVSDARYAAGALHGSAVLRDALRSSPAAMARLCRQSCASGLDLSRVAFLDLETTGLSRGAGTLAFLIGAGRFVGETFQLRQLFLRDPSEERAQLEVLDGWLTDCSGLVTYNGRSFDVPMLEGRMTMHGMSSRVGRLPHLDLLPPARRIWRRRLGTCTLQAVERSILGLIRQDDVPGWMIPERYTTYQRTGDARSLVGVFHHNVLDILSLVGLTAQLSRAFEEPHAVLEHGRDWLGIARAYEEAGDASGVVAAYEAALSRGLSPDETDEALLRLAAAAKRGGDWPRAVEVWEGLTLRAPPVRLAPFEELAKYYEHRSDPADAARALAWSERARELVETRAVRPRRGRVRAIQDLERRIARLRRKLAQRSAAER